MVLAVVGGIGTFTLYAFLLGHLRYGRYAGAGLTLAALLAGSGQES